ncbi:MAG: helix-turn-helix transcriptional regulator [Pirellulales bacterium]|nr:helix-turn-helix transcriptional regulator [Pirellulales bacterium]
MIAKLLRRGPLDPGAEDYLDALSDLVLIYEDEHIKFDDPSDAEMLGHLMEAKGVNQVQLAKDTGLGKSTISEILAGKRKLTRKNVAKLCAYFGVVQGVFSLDLDS